MIRTFDEIVNRAKEIGAKRAAILFPYNTDVLHAVMDGMREGLIAPVLVGDRERIISLAQQSGIPISNMEMIQRVDPQEAADLCLDMMVNNDVSFAVKGNILTAYLFRSLIRVTKRLAPEQAPCAICFHYLPAIKKIFAITDPGLSITPDLTSKEKILTNAIQVFRSLGYASPRVMVLAAKHLREESSQALEEARLLRQGAAAGKFGPCEFLPYTDLLELAKGDGLNPETFPDIFLVPHINAGNILVKTIDHIMAGIRQCVTVGGGMIILTPSRSDGYEVRIKNLALGLVLATAGRR